ncbi:glycosyltransferase 6 domain-containing protein 1 [Carlito syrichta]|uniref:Glycosyltransferase 6 domain-containing protein 1 n=1 Tax=Carlito syrichta TaxID=1868482 RepID=A0A1U7UU20_CARSF|nr:glycosyltransferase 6 domain-containing protein 1 [Carlito syrichta]
MYSKRRMLLLISFVLSLLLVERYFRSHQVEELELSDWFMPRRRPDVITTTDWLAPVIWEGTFNRQVLEDHYRRRNITVGLAVLVSGRFAHKSLGLFLRSASKYFMPGHRVIFYILMDTFVRLPGIARSPLHTFRVLKTGIDYTWHDLHLLHMKNLGANIVSYIQDEVDFLFCMAVDQVFQNRFGVETLAPSVAQLHSWWYFRNTKNFPYERRRNSAAFIPLGQGDFFYDGSTVGGTPHQVLNFIDKYLQGVIDDTRNGLNSTYERHLNKYFFLNKPTKLLSPEYNWDSALNLPIQIQYVKVARRTERNS